MSAVLSTTPKKDHTWDNGVVTTEPTAEKDGVKTYTCTVCNETKTETTPRLNGSGQVSCEPFKRHKKHKKERLLWRTLLLL